MNAMIFKSALNEKAGVIVQSVLASFFVALCAQIAIPCVPVPITFQTVAVLLVGSTLGSHKGALALLFYLLQGCLGAPVWAGGVSDVFRLLGPTGGYLMAYPLLAYFVGKAVEKKYRGFTLCFLFFFFICIQMGIGSLWLSQFVGIDRCLELGFYPFLLMEIFKSFFVVSYLKMQKKEV